MYSILVGLRKTRSPRPIFRRRRRKWYTHRHTPLRETYCLLFCRRENTMTTVLVESRNHSPNKMYDDYSTTSPTTKSLLLLLFFFSAHLILLFQRVSAPPPYLCVHWRRQKSFENVCVCVFVMTLMIDPSYETWSHSP